MGRHSKHTQAIEDEILTRLANGEPLTKICKSAHLPTVTTVFNWETTIPDFVDKVTRARELSADHYSYEIIEIADEKPTRKVPDPDGGTSICIDQAAVQRNKLRIDTRIKLMQMLKRKTYGDKVQQELSGPGGEPIRAEIEVRFVRSEPKTGDSEQTVTK